MSYNIGFLDASLTATSCNSNLAHRAMAIRQTGTFRPSYRASQTDKSRCACWKKFPRWPNAEHGPRAGSPAESGRFIYGDAAVGDLVRLITSPDLGTAGRLSRAADPAANRQGTTSQIRWRTSKLSAARNAIVSRRRKADHRGPPRRHPRPVEVIAASPLQLPASPRARSGFCS
jgi:hypothetical protein